MFRIICIYRFIDSLNYLIFLCLHLNRDLQLFLFTQVFTEHWSDLPPAPLKSTLYKFDYYHYYISYFF